MARGRERERERDTERDVQTDKPTDTQICEDTDTETHIMRKRE
jgi:hypothetical protein